MNNFILTKYDPNMYIIMWVFIFYLLLNSKISLQIFSNSKLIDLINLFLFLGHYLNFRKDWHLIFLTICIAILFEMIIDYGEIVLFAFVLV